MLTPEKEYEVTIGALRHHQSLIHGSVAPYSAITAALAAAIFTVKDLDTLAAFMGVVVSVIWWSLALRMRTYVKVHTQRLLTMEGELGVSHITRDDEDKRLHFWLRRLPSHSALIVGLYVAGIIVFSSLLFWKMFDESVSTRNAAGLTDKVQIAERAPPSGPGPKPVTPPPAPSPRSQ